MESTIDVREARRHGVVALGLFLGSALLVTYALHGSMPTNPVNLPMEERIHTSLWAPEGWKFFTRDPQEERARQIHCDTNLVV